MRFAASSPEIARKEDSDVEDDYMSDMFTDATSDVRPGMARSHSERRIMKIDYERSQVELRLRSVPKRAELEKEMRETALSKPISEQSKGFALLAKMGFKPGMSLGKSREGMDAGIKEPISVDVKTNRMGLGHKAEEEERRRQLDSLVRKRVAARAKSNQYLLGDFQKRKRIAAGQKRLIEDVMKSRKACQELDLRNGLSVPTGEYFWPIYRDRDEDDSKPSSSTRAAVDDQDDQEEEGVFRYSNGKLAPSEKQLSQMLEEELQQRLEEVKTYLRETHLYCVWCGCQYETSEELSGECPGDAREDHEGFDE